MTRASDSAPSNNTSSVNSSSLNQKSFYPYCSVTSRKNATTTSHHPTNNTYEFTVDNYPLYFTETKYNSNPTKIKKNFISRNTNNCDLTGPLEKNCTSSVSLNRLNFSNHIDDPPLLEELGINIEHIRTKSISVIFPVHNAISRIDSSIIIDDTDMAGPIVFAILLGGELLLAGKAHFGYIYGFGSFGCISVSLVINLMSPKIVPVGTIVSILGYSLLPVNFLAFINAIYRVKYMGLVGVLLAALTVVWCTVSSTRLFEKGCDMREQRYLLAYPNALLYSVFVIITIF